MNILDRIFGPPRKRTPPATSTPTPHEAAVSEEQQKQDELRQRETISREAAGKTVVSDDLEGFLQRSRETKEARLIAIEKRRTAEQRIKALQADALARRNAVIEVANQKEAETKAEALEESSNVDLKEGVAILEVFLDSRTGLSQAEIDAKLTTPQEKEDMRRARAFGDPRGIKTVLTKFKTIDPARLAQILPEPTLRDLLRGITAKPSDYPFWDF